MSQIELKTDFEADLMQCLPPLHEELRSALSSENSKDVIGIVTYEASVFFFHFQIVTKNMQGNV